MTPKAPARAIAIAACAATLAIAWHARPAAAARAAAVDILHPTAALPVAIATSLRDPAAMFELSTGEAVVFDRRSGVVSVVDAARTKARVLLSGAPERGGLVSPGAVAIGPEDLIAVADSLHGYDRIQYFTLRGTRVGILALPDPPRSHVTVNGFEVNGIGSLQFAKQSFFVNLPARGQLVSEIGTNGETLRQFGQPRRVGDTADPPLDAMLNIGIPLVDPTGGFDFVFQTGVPMLRKYDASGALVFERHIEGPELDASIAALPTVWRRPGGEGRLPITQPLVRSAAVDELGRVWVGLGVPYVYVYDRRGEKIRTIQLNGAGPIVAESLSFAKGYRLLVTPGCYEFTIEHSGNAIPGARFPE